MFQIKLAAVLFLPMALFSSIAAAQQPQSDSLAKFISSPQFKLPQPTSEDLASAITPEPPIAETTSSTSGYVRNVPAPPPAKEKSATRPFHSLAVAFIASTAGAGIEFATPVSRSFNLRAGFNTFAFNYPFSIDGVYYNARLHLQSSGTSLDWFPLHSGFHISPGILYVKNTLAAPASVGVGQAFELGKQPFINSVDDPVTGTSAVVVPRKFAPMLLFGFSNIIPRTGQTFFSSRRVRRCLHRRSSDPGRARWNRMHHTGLRRLRLQRRSPGGLEAGGLQPQRRPEACPFLSHTLDGTRLSLLIDAVVIAVVAR